MRPYLLVLILILTFLIGMVVGTLIGIQKGQYMLFEGVGIALSGSNTNITIDINETELINQANKTLIPELRKIFGKELAGVEE